ncbi:hypothetical protein [Vibrio cyclitrophicus]|uniref:hypothetical protein n=1 Tax=Vibrio cyclitrophicus TaxID=47951 RepID=UPI0032E4C63B
MPRKTKLFRFTDHRTKPSRLVFVRATSQQQAATLCDVQLSHIKAYLCIADEEQNAMYSHLKDGEFEYQEHIALKRTGISDRDFEKINAVGHLKSARLILNQCDVTTKEEKDKLYQIFKLLDELSSDIAENNRNKYFNR